MVFNRLYDFSKTLAMFMLALAVGFSIALFSLPAQAKAATPENTGGSLQAGSEAVMPTTQATAKKMTLENARGTVHVYPSMYAKGEYFIAYFDLQSSDPETLKEPTKLKSSNKSICEVSSSYGELSCYIDKPGKTTVSYTWKGKRHSVKLIVHKWTLPMTTFKVNGKNYASKFKKSWAASSSSKYITGKVKVKSKKGWKLVGLTAANVKDHEKTIKNNKTVLKKSSKIKCIYATFRNIASGQEVNVALSGKGFAAHM